MTNKPFVLAALFVLFNSLAGFSQTTAYTIEDVWQKTINYYPSLTSKKELIEEQKFRKELVKKKFLPELIMQAQQNYGTGENIPASFFPLPGVYTSTGNSQVAGSTTGNSSMHTSALLQWNFLQFGRQKSKLKVADAAIGLSVANLTLEEWNLISKVTRIYFAAVQSQAAVDLARKDSKRLADLLDLTKAQVDAGLQPGADSLLLKSSLLQSQAKQYEQQGILKEKLVKLSSYTGENGHDISLDNSFYYHFSNDVPDNNAGINHPYIQAYNARIKQAETEVDLVRKEVYPSISLIAGTGIKGSGLHSNGSANKGLAAPWENASANYLGGIGVTWNFSSLYQNKTKQSIAGRAVASLNADKEAAQIQLNARFQSALVAWGEQIQNLQASEAALKASLLAYELYEVRYESGLINLIELLQLQKSLQDAERNYLAAVSIYWDELLKQAESLGNFSHLLNALKK